MADTTNLDAIIDAGVSAIATVELWTEIRDLLKAVSGETGSVTLAGRNTGVEVSLTTTFDATTDYDVFFYIEKAAAAKTGSIGEVTITKNSGSAFTVKNSGSDSLSTLNYKVMKRA